MTKFAFGEKWCNKKWPAARNNQLKTKRRTERANVAPYKPLYAARIFCWVVGAIFVLAYKYVFMCVKKWGIKCEFFIPPFGKKYEHTQTTKRTDRGWESTHSLRLKKEQTPDRQTPAKSVRLKAAKGSAQKLLKFGVRVCVCPPGVGRPV